MKSTRKLQHEVYAQASELDSKFDSLRVLKLRTCDLAAEFVRILAAA